jgi:hypothetical protein
MFTLKSLAIFASTMGFFAIVSNSQAQNPQRCVEAGTFTGIGNATNPLHPTEPQRINRFNWQTATYPTWFSNNNNTSNLVQMHSPFYQPANSHILPLVLSNDSKPQEGWELIYDERGFIDQVTPPITPPPAHTAVVLYNRNTGILRVMAARAAQFTDYNAARIALSFENGSKFPSTLAMATALTGLDMFKNEALVSATNFNNQQYMWFYADFPMTYDPCTCQGNTTFKASISFIKNSKISLKGSTLGELVSVQNNSGAINRQKGPWSLQNLQGSIKKANEMYGSLDQWKNETMSQINASNKPTEDQKKNEVAANALIKFLREAQVGTLLDQIPMVGAAFAFIEAFVGATPEANTPQVVEVAPMVMTANHEFEGEINEFAPQFDIVFRLPGSQEIAGQNIKQPYYDEIMGQFSLLQTPTVYQRHARYFRDHTSPHEYLLEEKTYDYFSVDVNSIKPVINKTVFEENYESVKYGLVFDMGYVQRYYFTRVGKDSVAQVAKNITELEQQLGRKLTLVSNDSVLVPIPQKPSKNNLTPQRGGGNVNLFAPFPINDGLEQDYYKTRRYTDTDPRTGITTTYVEYKWRYRTPLLCTSCIGDSENENFIFNNFHSIFMTSWTEYVQSLDPNNPFSWAVVRAYPSVEKVSLKVVAALQTKPTPYSSTSRTVLAERTFDVKLQEISLNTNDEYAFPETILASYYSPSNVKEIVTIADLTVSSGTQEFIAWDGFIIGDNINIAAGAKVLLTSIGQHIYDKNGNKIQLPTGFEFKDPSNPLGTTGSLQFICKQDSEYSSYNHNHSQNIDATVANFCSSRLYKNTTRGYARIERQDETVAELPTSNNNIMAAYPNPATDRVTIQYHLLEDGVVSITLSDLLGRVIGEVINYKEQEKGTYKVDFSTENLSNGIYICTIHTLMGKQVIKIMVSK